eukprot:6937750-Prorocentrum_lima.AAC.1
MGGGTTCWPNARCCCVRVDGCKCIVYVHQSPRAVELMVDCTGDRLGCIHAGLVQGWAWCLVG